MLRSDVGWRLAPSYCSTVRAVTLSYRSSVYQNEDQPYDISTAYHSDVGRHSLDHPTWFHTRWNRKFWADSISFSSVSPMTYDDGYRSSGLEGQFNGHKVRRSCTSMHLCCNRIWTHVVTATGSLLVERTIPFSDVRGAWLQCDLSVRTPTLKR